MHQLIPTEDGSVTLYVPALNEHYHSVHGAIQESNHIFIQAGLQYFLETHPDYFNQENPLFILEAGFGTGLNAYLTLLQAIALKIPIQYHSIEKYPLTEAEIESLNYPDQITGADRQLFRELHHAPWNKPCSLSPYFMLHKHEEDFREIDFQDQFHVVYYDAFNPDVQPHLWTTEVFQRFYQAMQQDSILVTYCVKGIVKQALRANGFTLKRLPGPPGKREMLRASKHLSL
jgi:tRNA U34 5-methylaminomethyl-2-thiouridine-forming methyltransferase MnmC